MLVVWIAKAIRSRGRWTNPAWTRGRVAGLPSAGPGSALLATASAPIVGVQIARQAATVNREGSERWLRPKCCNVHTDVDRCQRSKGLYQDDTWRPLFAQLRCAMIRCIIAACRLSARTGPSRATTISLRLNSTMRTFRRVRSWVASRSPISRRGRSGRGFIRMDPPGHTAQRRAPSRRSLLRQISSIFQTLIRKRTAAVLDALPRNETFDWVQRVSVELTNMMLATLFDFPWADREKLTWWSDVAIANVDSPDAVVHSERRAFRRDGQDGRVFPQIVGCARRRAAGLRPDLDAGAFGGDAKPAAARIHRHDWRF